MYLTINKTPTGANHWMIFDNEDEFNHYLQNTKESPERVYTGETIERVLFENKIDETLLNKIYDLPMEATGIVEHRVREFLCVGLSKNINEKLVTNIIAIKKAERLF